MNRFFKKSAIALVVLGLAGTACAGTVDGLFLGGEGLYMQARNDDLQFVTVFPNTLTGLISNVNIIPSYTWGWRLFGGVKFCGNEDITVSWLKFNDRDRRSIATPGSLVPGIPGFSEPRWFFPGEWTHINGHVSDELNDVYAVFGHTINFQPWSVRLAGGVEWAKLYSNLTVAADIFDDPAITTAVGFQSWSHSRGVGPRVEVDMAYHLPYNFSVFSDANAALLISYRNISLNSLNDLEFHSNTFSKRHVVIPKFGVRLGVAYSYGFGQVGGEGVACRTTALTLAAGWQAETYVHAIERPDPASETVIPGVRRVAPIPIENLGTTVSNYATQGLFLGAKISTDWL